MRPVQLDLVEWIRAQQVRPAPSPECAPVVLHRIDPAQRMARFYRLGIERDLFGTWCLVREWGRIGKRGQRRLESYAAAEQAQAARARICAAKGRRGYVHAA